MLSLYRVFGVGPYWDLGVLQAIIYIISEQNV